MFDELYAIVDSKVRAVGSGKRTKDIHSLVLTDRRVREILEIETPEIEDVSEIIEVSKGKVCSPFGWIGPSVSRDSKSRLLLASS